jgi:hypothetical protein
VCTRVYVHGVGASISELLTSEIIKRVLSNGALGVVGVEESDRLSVVLQAVVNKRKPVDQQAVRVLIERLGSVERVARGTSNRPTNKMRRAVPT